MYADISDTEVLILSGVAAALEFFMYSVLRSWDHIIVQTPWFQSYFTIAEELGCDITELPFYEETWLPDIETLKKSITPKTKAIIINFPNNPTGQSISSAVLYQIIDICIFHDIYLFSDEIYRGLEFDESSRLPAVADIYLKGISVSSLSKTLWLWWLRVGWFVTKDTALLKEVSKRSFLNWYCNSIPSEFLASVALNHHDDIIWRNMQTVRNNYRIVQIFMEKYRHLFEYIPVQAWCTVFVRIKDGVDIARFYETISQEWGIFISNWEDFHFQKQYFRLGFWKKDFPEMLKKIEWYLDNYE